MCQNPGTKASHVIYETTACDCLDQERTTKVILCDSRVWVTKGHAASTLFSGTFPLRALNHTLRSPAPHSLCAINQPNHAQKL